MLIDMHTFDFSKIKKKVQTKWQGLIHKVCKSQGSKTLGLSSATMSCVILFKLSCFPALGFGFLMEKRENGTTFRLQQKDHLPGLHYREAAQALGHAGLKGKGHS